jgi:carbon-monoxide dehydrogenase large subunit
MQAPERGALATDRVRFVDDPVACVIAETRAQARDAAEAVVVPVDPLPAVVEASAAAAPGAPVLFDRPGGTVVLDFHYGNRDKVAEAFAKAAHTARVPLRNNRVVVAAMEPRSALATYDSASGRSTIHIRSHRMFLSQNDIAGDIPKVPVEKVRVLTGNVGGSFGMKASAYPKYVCLLHAGKELGRPVK